MVMNENKKVEIFAMLQSELKKYWNEKRINTVYSGKTIVHNEMQRLEITNFNEILNSLCSIIIKQDDLPTISGRGQCFIETPNDGGCSSQNIKFYIDNKQYERIFENDTIQIIINDLSLKFV